MALVCTDIRALYGGFVAVDGVSLSVDAGHILGVAGPNGAGKTTLFDVLSGYHSTDGGRVELNGADITRLPAHRRVRLGLARTFQSPIVPTELTIGETLEAARVAWSPKVEPAAIRPARELARFTTADRVRCGGLDTLDRRKLLLTCVLMRGPGVLLLDEPCSGLMQDEIDEMDAIIRQMVAETSIAVIVVEHRLELLHAVAESVVVMDAGQVIAAGPPAAVFNDPAVRAAYFEAPQAA
ncbi:MAG: ATP-binding cassette domain-containing protein [Thermoleophilia bacterium]|nr:ATP-binding cassette domain-containing protein [Thermoleophilia bacterium]